MEAQSEAVLEELVCVGKRIRQTGWQYTLLTMAREGPWDRVVCVVSASRGLELVDRAACDSAAAGGGAVAHCTLGRRG